MIVAVTGTGYPFPRLVQALASHAAANPDEAVWVQHGKTPLVSPLDGLPLVPREELMSRMQAADVVVCHGGSGSIADALRAGHVPVVVPRLEALREHVNDHQLEIVEALGGDGRIVPLHDLEGLSEAVELSRARSRDVSRAEPGVQLREAIRNEVDARGCRRAARTKAMWTMLSIARLIHRPARV